MPEFSLARTFRNRGLLLQTGSQFSNSAFPDSRKSSYSPRLLYVLMFGNFLDINTQGFKKYVKGQQT